ncbi:MAG: ankyrin repeat domain-containing protein [Candidatus Sericytochromatia bacterium]|nr:ankyrin repeat domain-containing protein [Candidatus Sericytochromatia bacterium]
MRLKHGLLILFLSFGGLLLAFPGWADVDLDIALLQAINTPNLAQVKFLIKQGAKVDGSWNTGVPLADAVGNRNLEISRYLIENGADVNKKYFSGDSLLSEAIKSQQFELVKLLVDNGADTNAYTLSGQHGEFESSPLFEAAKVGNLDILKYLLTHGADPNYVGEKEENSPLILAVRHGHFDAVKFLVASGADPSFKSKFDVTALMASVKTDNLDILQFLLPYSKDSQEKLIATACLGKLQTLKDLLQKGADLNRHIGLPNPLKAAAHCKQFETVAFLIESGADIEAINPKSYPFDFGTWEDTMPPLIWAIRAGNLKILRYLREHGAKLNGLAAYYLSKAVYTGELELVQDFFETLQLKPAEYEHSPMAFVNAVQAGHLNMLEYFIQKGLDINIFDEDSICTVLEEAADFSSSEFSTELEKIDSFWYKKDIYLIKNKLIQDTIQKRITLLNFLISNGANIDKKSKGGETSFQKVIEAPFSQSNKHVIEYMAQFSKVPEDRLNAALIFADVALFKTYYQQDRQAYFKQNIFPKAIELALDKASYNNNKALEQNYDEIIKFLVQEAEKPEEIFDLAIRRGHLKTLQWVLEKAPHFKARLKRNPSLFQQALDSENADMIQYFIQEGVELNPLAPEVIALYRKIIDNNRGPYNPSLIRLLILQGVDPDLQDESGQTVLDHLIFQNNYEKTLETIKFIIKNGAKLQNKTLYRDLLSAASLDSDRTEILKYLLTQGLDPNLTNSSEEPPLFNAISSRNLEAIKALVKYGANPKAHNREGMTTLMQAALVCSDLDTIHFLIQQGVNPFAQDRLEKTMLDYASECSHYLLMTIRN